MKYNKKNRYRCNSGIMELKFSTPAKNSPTFKFEPPTDKTVGSQHTVLWILLKKDTCLNVLHENLDKVGLRID